LASSFIASDAQRQIGFLPREDETVPDILHGMCGRCHAADADPRLLRARFNVQAIDRIDSTTAFEIRRRLTAPRDSPELMPPLRVGELSSRAIERIERYLRDHCEQPGRCG
jgi:hypothetical protein